MINMMQRIDTEIQTCTQKGYYYGSKDQDTYQTTQFQILECASDTGKALKNDLYIYFDTLEPSITGTVRYNRKSRKHVAFSEIWASILDFVSLLNVLAEHLLKIPRVQ